MRSVHRQRLYRTEAIVLRGQDFGEADKLLTLYTPMLGKIRVLAKGVRKLKSRKGGHLELFTHSNLLLAKGKSLDIVTQAETIHPFLGMRRELRRTSYAYYAAELLDRFTEERVENRPLFELFLNALSWLADAEDPELALRYFELHMLSYVGYRPQLFECVRCACDIESAIRYFSPEDGGVLCSRCGEGESGCHRLSAQVLATARYLQTEDYELCRRLRIYPPAHQELETLMRRYIVYLLERRLKSVDFMEALRREAALTGTKEVEET